MHLILEFGFPFVLCVAILCPCMCFSEPVPHLVMKNGFLFSFIIVVGEWGIIFIII